MKNLVYIDFESFFDSKTFTLKKMSMFEYVKSPEFKAHGVGIAEGNQKSYWVSAADLENYFDQGWDDTTFVAHNMKFDGGILSWIYGVRAAGYICTQSMAR